jgi:hypothetical protein
MKKFLIIILVSVAVQSCKKASTPRPTTTTPVNTDALTKPQVDTLVKKLTEFNFHDVADSTRLDGKDDAAWTAATLDSYPLSIHFAFTVTSTDNNIISGMYQEIYDSNNAVNVNGTFLISANGKTITTNDGITSKTVEIVELTSAEYVYIVYNYAKGVDYKFVATKY